LPELPDDAEDGKEISPEPEASCKALALEGFQILAQGAEIQTRMNHRTATGMRVTQISIAIAMSISLVQNSQS